MVVERRDAAGTIDITSMADGDHVVLTWMERGGPRIEPPDGPAGFGSKLIHRSISGQPGGSIG